VYLQRSGVAGSPEVHFALTSSLSAGANGLLVDSAGCNCCIPVIKTAAFIQPVR